MTDRVPFWSVPSSFWHYHPDDVYQQFTYINLTSQLSALDPRYLGPLNQSLTAPIHPSVRGLHCQKSFTPHRYQ